MSIVSTKLTQKSKSTKKNEKKSNKLFTILIIILASIFVFRLLFLVMNKGVGFSEKGNKIKQEKIISSSPTNKYSASITYSDNQLPDGLEIQNSQGSTLFRLNEYLKTDVQLSNETFVWDEDGQIAAFSYVPEPNIHNQVFRHEPTNAYLIVVSLEDGTVLNSYNLGSLAYYGNNVETLFPLKMSPNKKQIAVQIELIHQISVFGVEEVGQSNFATKYESTPLFSDEMYQLENNRYSPFLDYQWSPDGKTIQYKLSTMDEYLDMNVEELMKNTDDLQLK